MRQLMETAAAHPPRNNLKKSTYLGMQAGQLALSATSRSVLTIRANCPKIIQKSPADVGATIDGDRVSPPAARDQTFALETAKRLPDIAAGLVGGTGDIRLRPDLAVGTDHGNQRQHIRTVKALLTQRPDAEIAELYQVQQHAVLIQGNGIILRKFDVQLTHRSVAIRCTDLHFCDSVGLG